jgi:hypothetical protein
LAIKLSSMVRVEVPANWVGTTVVRLCVDDECQAGLLAIEGPSGAIVSFTPGRRMEQNVRMTMSTTVPLDRAADRSVEGTIRTHDVYPGCQSDPIAAARFDPSTGTLLQSDWTWGKG